MVSSFKKKKNSVSKHLEQYEFITTHKIISELTKHTVTQTHTQTPSHTHTDIRTHPYTYTHQHSYTHTTVNQVLTKTPSGDKLPNFSVNMSANKDGHSPRTPFSSSANQALVVEPGTSTERDTSLNF